MKRLVFIVLFVFLSIGTALATDIEQLTKAAQNGDLVSAKTLGEMYLYGEGIEKDVITGRQWLQKAAENNDSEAQYTLGESYYRETLENVRYGLPNKSEKALYWLIKAFGNGLLEAGYYIGDLYFKGGNTNHDFDKAKQFWEAAAQAGNTSARIDLANFDNQVAAKVNLTNLIKQANNGDVTAAKELANIYLIGRIVFADTKEYIKWIQKAAELGDLGSQRFLANAYEYGSFGLPIDYKKTLCWYQAAAAQNDPMAQLRLLEAELKGELGLTANPKEAAKKIIALAEDGFVYAQFLLVNMYLAGNGVSQNYQLAMKWLTQLAKSENIAWAANKLGDLYLNGVGIEQNYELAKQWYLIASSLESNEGAYKLAEMYMQGLGTEQNYSKAMDLYLKVAKDINSDLQLKSKARLWEFYYYGLLGSSNDVEAFELAEELAGKDKPEGYYGLALAYYEGKPVSMNDIKALMWLKKLFEAKDVPLKIMDDAKCLAKLVLDRATDDERKQAGWSESLTIDRFSGFNYEALLGKAQLNDGVTQFELAQRFYEGAGVKQNYKEAMAWYIKAAENNNAEAQYRLGQIYYEGIATPINYKNAFYWTLKAAEAGYVKAQYSLSKLYEKGIGVQKNLEQSFLWRLRAADQEYPDAQYNVAKMYFYGIGTTIDYINAYVWMAKAHSKKEYGKSIWYNEFSTIFLELIFPSQMNAKDFKLAQKILKNQGIVADHFDWRWQQ